MTTSRFLILGRPGASLTVSSRSAAERLVALYAARGITGLVIVEIEVLS